MSNWVYTYDEQGLVYKHQVMGVVDGFYILTGRPEPVNAQYVYRTKKECLQGMKDAGIEKKSLQMATIISLGNKITKLTKELAEKEDAITNLIEDSKASKEFLQRKVCDEVRQAINECDWVLKDGFYYIKQVELNDKIDQIEQGVEK